MVFKTSKSWAIVQFKPNAHKIAERNLRQQKFETFLPFEEITKSKNAKLLTALRPLFPGYMFVVPEKEHVDLYKINCTYGVSRLLTFNNEPYLVSQSLITAIKARCNQAGVLLPHKEFNKDDRVRIVSGPFDNFLATVISIDKNQRVWVLIDLMGQSTRALVKTEKLKYAT